MSVSEIVVGLDFGTTYSGVSWAVNGGSKAINLIRNWPNHRSKIADSDKVPTTITYRNGKPYNWGYDVGIGEDSFRWFKILLDPKHQFSKTAAPVLTSQRLLNSLGKTAEEVAADYLRLLWNYTQEEIRKSKGDNWTSIYSVKIILTVPAIWSPAAKDRTERIAKAAGLPEDISLVTEPEAAALTVLKEAHDADPTLTRGDSFVVCDAGGGTVDLISYKVTQLSPLQLQECAIGDGGLCGSTFVDEAFEKYIRTLVGEQQYNHIKEKSRKSMLQEFEDGVKRCFEGTDKEFSVDLRGVEDDPSHGIIDETIPLRSGVLTTVFDHVCNKIVVLVEKQIQQVEDKGGRVKAILLVGGFGASSYLHKRLETAHRSANIQVLRIDGAWSSICRGATLWGLEHSENSTYTRATVASRIARHSYGVALSALFNPAIHSWQDRYTDPSDGRIRAANQMRWLLRRGEDIEEGRVLHLSYVASVQVGFWDSGSRAFGQELYYCEDESPPTRKERSVFQLCEVNFTIDCSKLWMEKSYKNPSTREKWRDATLDIGILLGNANLHFAIAYKDDLAAVVEAKYKEQF